MQLDMTRYSNNNNVITEVYYILIVQRICS